MVREILLSMILIFPLLVSGQELQPPPWTITSDYGPRNVTQGSWFHEGIDYGGSEGADIPAVEGGKINRIGPFTGAGWGIEISTKIGTSTRVWWYWHIFSGTMTSVLVSSPIPSGNWELRSAKLKHPVTGKIDDANVIVLWNNKESLRATKVLSISDFSGRQVYISTTPILNTTGLSTITAQGSVETTNPIAPVGTSGGYPPHLHIGLNQNRDNPLLYLTHADGAINVTIDDPPDGYIMLPGDLDGEYPVKVTVNSTAGLDLDKLTLYVFSEDGKISHHFGSAGLPTFGYGGRLNAETGGFQTASVNQANIEPLDADPTKPDNQPGLDAFTYRVDFGALDLPDGRYRLEAKARDVNTGEYSSSSTFSVDRTAVSCRAHSISPLYDNFYGTSTLNPSTLETAHTIDFTDAVSGISTITITGPSGEIYSRYFEPPVLSTNAVLADMAVGQYVIEAVDAAGNVTVAPFKISDIRVYVDTAASSQEYVYSDLVSPGVFNFKINARVESLSELQKIQLLDATGKLLSEKPLSGLVGSVTFDLPPLSQSQPIGAGWDYGNATYQLKAYDNQGAFKHIAFVLSGGNDGIEAAGNYAQAGVYNGDVYDMLQYPFYYLQPPILPGAEARNYNYITAETPPYAITGTQVNNTLWPATAGAVEGTCADDPTAEYANLGTAKYVLNTWGQADKSDIQTETMQEVVFFTKWSGLNPSDAGTLCISARSSYPGYEVYWLCSKTSTPAKLISLKRYTQIRVELNPTNELYFNSQFLPSGLCSRYKFPALESHSWAYFSGYRVAEGAASVANVASGNNIAVLTNQDITVTFSTVTTPGNLNMTLTTEFPPVGDTALPSKTLFGITPDEYFDFEGTANISFKYDPAGLTAGQENSIKLVKVIDASTGKYEETQSALDPVNDRVSADVASFGKFMVVASAYATPQSVQGGDVSGKPELEFLSNSAVVSEQISTSSVFLDTVIRDLEYNNLTPVGDVYYLTPDGLSLSPAGAIKMRYDKTKLTATGISEANIALYEFTAAGDLIFKPTRQTQDTANGEISAEVSKLHSLFAVLGPAPYNPYSSDIMYPETTISYVPVSYSTGDALYISSGTHITLTSSDWPESGGSGVKGTYYYVDKYPDLSCLKSAVDVLAPQGDCRNSRYSVPFSLQEGTHTVYYFSADNARNYESIQSTAVFVDGTAPWVQLTVGTTTIDSGGTAYLTDTDSVTLTAADIPSKDIMSGLAAIHVFINVSPAECPSGHGGINGLGSCENPYYPGPFTLPAGEHALYYQSVDNVGNISGLKTASITVHSDDITPPETTLWINSQAIVASATGYMTVFDTITLTAVDEGSGVNGIYYTINTAFSPDTAFLYVASIPLPPGTHTVYYSAMDKAGNREIPKSASITVRQPDMMPAGYIRAFAGTGTYGYTGDWGNALNATFASPNGLAIGGNGDVMIADTYNHVLRQIDSSGIVRTFAGTGVAGSSGDNGPAAYAQFNRPYSVAFNSKGDIYIADNRNNKVRKIAAATGQITTVANIPYPEYLAIDGNDAVYVSESYYKIDKILPDGQVQTVAGTGVSGYSGDGGLAVNAKFSTLGGIAFDAENNLYLSDTYNRRVRKVDALTGVINTVAGGGSLTGNDVPALQKNIGYSKGIAVNKNGDLLIANGAVLFRLDRATSLIAAESGEGYVNITSAPVPAQFAFIPYAYGLATNTDGGVYIMGGNRIWKTSLPGTAKSADAALRIYSNSTAIGIVPVPPGSPEEIAFLSMARQRSLLSASTIYAVSPAGGTLVPPGSALFKYNPQVVADTSTLAIYSYDGVTLSSVPPAGLRGQQILPSKGYPAGNLAAGIVDRTPALLGLLTYISDKFPPHIELAIGSPAFGPAPVFVSQKTVFTLTASDDLYKAGDKKGFGVVRTATRIKKDGILVREIAFNNPTPASGQVFVSTFTLDLPDSGTYTLEYYSTDAVGNVESAHTALVRLDTEHPLADLMLEGPVEPAGDGFNSLVGFNMRIVSTDTASGIAVAIYLVDIATDTCDWSRPIVPTDPAGTCGNPVYSAPFRLAQGPHTIYVSAVDNVENAAGFKVYAVNVNPPEYTNTGTHPYFEKRSLIDNFGSASADIIAMAAGPDGAIYATYYFPGQNKVRKFDKDGALISEWGTQYGFGSLGDIDVCPDNTIWIIDYSNYSLSAQLRKLSADGAALLSVPVTQQQGNWPPVSITCDRNDNLYFLGGSAKDRIYRLNSSGNKTGEMVISNPNGTWFNIVADSAGDIYSADPSSGKLRKYSWGTGLTGEWPAQGSKLVMDLYDNIYLAGSGSISIYTNSGNFVRSFSKVPVGYSELNLGVATSHIAVNPKTGLFLFAEDTSPKIQVLGPDFTPPARPEITTPVTGATVMTDRPFFYGRGESGARISMSDGASPIFESMAGADGYFSGSVPLSGYGTHNISAVAVDAAGNTSAPTATISLTMKSLMSVALSSAQYAPENWNVNDASTTVVADFNKDGNADIVIFSFRGTYYEGNYSFYAGKGDGTFNYTYTATLGMSLSAADDGIVADFNNDGNLDIAISVQDYSSNSNTISIMLGNGDGTFSAPAMYGFTGRYAELAALDLNHDGATDIVTNSGSNMLAYVNDGAGGFSLTFSTPFPAGAVESGGWAAGIKAADIDLDGNSDVVAGNTIFFGNASGKVSENMVLPLFGNTNVTEVEISDLNKDGYPDIVLCSMPGMVRSYLNLKNRTFIVSSENGVSYPNSADIGDFNGDGAADIVVSPLNIRNMTLLLGKGDGTFAPAVNFPTGVEDSWISPDPIGNINASDLNNDMLPDVVMAPSMAVKPNGSYVRSFIYYINNTPVPDVTPPASASLAARAENNGDVVINWTAPGDDGTMGKASYYYLRSSPLPIVSDTDFDTANAISGVPAPKFAGTSEEFRVSGLAGGATWYFALKTVDEAGNVSGFSNSPGVFLKYLAKSTCTVDGNPEIMLSAYQQPVSVLPVSTSSPEGMIALSTAAEQGLFLTSNLYDMRPEMNYDPPATLVFYYSTANLGDIPEDELFVYEHFPGEGWKKLDGQTRDTANHRITVPIYKIASLAGVFWKTRDMAAPRSVLAIAGDSWQAENGSTYLSGRSSITLTAYDPVVYGTSTGVEFTEFRIDPGTSTPFALYIGPFTLADGAHIIEFRSRDKAGNVEIAKSSAVFADGEPPSLGLAIAGSSFTAEGIIFVSIGSTVTLTASDAAAGLKSLYYSVNNTTYTTSSSTANMYLPSGGEYVLAYYADDNVNNVGVSHKTTLYVDTASPVTAFTPTGVAGRNGWYLSPVVVTLAASDGGSGVHGTQFSLDGSSFVIYTSSFAIAAEGAHGVLAYTIDNTGNIESTKSFAFKLDTSTPAARYSLVPAPNAAGWNNSAVDVIITGTDAISGIAYCSSSFTVSGEGQNVPLSGYCMDYAGGSSTTTFTVSIDTTAPDSKIELAGAAGRNDWYTSPVAATLVFTDNLSGVDKKYYSLDGSSFAIYSSSIIIAAEGIHSLKYYATDLAGNTESVKETILKLDLGVPSVMSVSSPVANGYGWNNGAVTVAFNGSDSASGIDYCTSVQIMAMQGSSQTITGYCIDYAGLSSTATLTVSIDTTLPIIQYTQTPTANEYGWLNRDVTLKFSCSDDLSGLQECPADIILSAEGINISTSAQTSDYADNSSIIKVDSLNIDKMAPATTADVAGNYHNGWYSSAVNVLLSSTDSLSGVKNTFYSLDGGSSTVYEQPIAVSAEGRHTVAYHSMDKAGNTEEPKALTFSIDKSSPIVSYTLAPQPNASGWNKSAVLAVFTGTDTLSGVVECSSQTISIEGPGQNISGWCRDVAGNIGYAQATVNIDLTQPAIAALPEPAANSYGWNSSTVTVKFSCSDNLSGVAACPADIALLSEGADISTSAVVFDFAGNQAKASVNGINIDLGLPTSTAALSGSFRNGYYNTPVVVSLTSSDSLSGIEKTVYSLDGGQFTEYQAPLSITGDGRHTVKYYALDKAGNTEPEHSVTFVIDATLPSMSYVIAPQPNQNGWNHSTVQVVFSGTDTLSGIDACIGTQNITIEGRSQNIAGWCRDIAGNISYATATLNIDLTAPVASAVQIPEPNAAGWNKTPVSAAFSGTDGMSGIAYCSPGLTVSIEGTNQTVSGYCMDYAGWSSTATLTLNIDMSAPVISISSPVTGQTFIATRNKLDISFIVKDNLDSTPKIGAFLVQTEDGGSPRGDRSKVISVTNGQSIEPLDIDDGVWHLSVSATDFADNPGTANSGAFEVIHDILPPRSSLYVETLKRYDSGTVIYVRKDARFELLSTDDLVTLNDGLGLGVGKQAIGIKTEGSAPRELTFNNPTPKPATAFTSTFMLDKELDGLYTLSYNAEDVLVNKEKILVSIYAVDNTSPNTMAVVMGASYQFGNNIYLNKASGLVLSAVDVSSNGVASGLKEIRYNLDNGGWVTYTSTLAISGLSEGVHSLVYYSADNLDNTEASKTYAFIADFTAPASAYSIGSPYYIAGGINYITPETPISFDAADSLFGGTASGVSRIEVSIDGSAFIAYNAPLKLSEGRHTITYRAIDNVGNTETEKTVKVQSDNTSPVSAWSISEGQSLEKDNRFYLNANGRIALSSVDPIINNVASGVERINYGIDAAPDTMYTSPVSLTEGIRIVNYSAKDNVGNAEVAKSTIIYVDGTSPDTGLSLSGDQYKGDRQYISQRTEVILTAMDPAVNDVAVGVKETKYAVDGGQFNDYAPFKLAAEGKRVVSFYSADYVGNMETVKNAELWVDTTTPATLLAISGARYDTEGVIYITRDSGVTLTGADLGNAAASGLMFTKYRLDGGAWQVYAGSFTINTEGRHVLAYYSLDHVQNTEDMKISSITVDNTVPISSLILGEPRFTAFGLPVITPDTPIMITAADAGAASGVAGLHYELYDAMSGELKFAGSYFEPLKVSLQGTFILKYWAVDNVGNMEPSKEARFAVTTLQQSGLIAAAGLNMSGTADISGKTASNGVIALSGNTRILGDVAASTITLTGKAQITGQQTTGVTPVAPAPIILSEISRSVRGVNDNALIDAKYLPEGKLTANGKEIITLSTGTYYLKGISLAGGASIVLAGPVAILVEGDININGGSVLNSGGIASGLNIFVSTNSTLSFTGGGSLAAYVYAPYSDLKLAGNALLGGHYFVHSATLSGTGNIIQSGETLPLVTASLPDGGNGKKGVSAAGGSYSVSAGPDPAFRLGEVYVFPNPAKAGAKPVFHVETGIADNVKVTVYTVSGRVAHERTLAGLPVALDDGNGLDYAYEYAWDGHIPSGVYYYLVEAAKAGQKLKKTGKFVVVR